MPGKNWNGIGPIMKNQIEKKNQEAKPPTNMSKTDQRSETKRVQKQYKKNTEKKESSKMDFSQLCWPETAKHLKRN